MKVRNRRNGMNTLAYKLGGITKSEIIPAGSVVNLVDLTDFNQVVNKHDFNRGWFEFVQENIQVELAQESELQKAKKEAEKYSAEKVKKVKTKNK